MKKLINAVEDVVSESLAGFCAAHSDIVRMGESAPFVQRRHSSSGKVALVSGGGSGHEPLHAGFVGYGMLDAACPGQVFTSPTPDQIVPRPPPHPEPHSPPAAAGGVPGAGASLTFLKKKNGGGGFINFDMAREMV